MAGARTRDGRSWLPPRITVFAVVAVVVAAIAFVVAGPGSRQAADLSGYPAGVSAAGVARASSLAQNSNVPPAILAALPQALGTDPTRPAVAYSAAQRAAAIQRRSPIGPYGLVYADVYAFAKAYKIVPLSFNEMADPQRSGNWLVGAAAAVIHAKHLSAGAVNFTAGTTDQPYFNPKTNTVEQRTVIATAAGSAARATARRSWISILSALPVAGIGTRASGIFDSALHWTIVGSLSQICGGVPLSVANTYVVPVAGTWTNPVSSTGIATPFGSGSHDGVDLAANAGTPVYAAASGVVKLVGGDPAVGAAGGAHALVLYVGNGLTFAYQDLDSDAVSDGQQVGVGQFLGTVAAAPTDNQAVGPHLHFGVNTVHAYASNQVTWVDPVAFMQARGVALGTGPVGAPSRVQRSATTSVRTTEAATATQGLMDMWQGAQLSTAAAIVSQGQRLRVPSWGIQIAVMTAMRSSRLGNEIPMSGSPRGVFGLPNSWGSLRTRTTLMTAAHLFYSRLVRVPNWQTIPPWVAASRTGAYAGSAAESYRAMWSGAGVIMTSLGAQSTTSIYGTEATTGGGCTGAPSTGTPTVNLSGGFRVASFNLKGCTASGTTGPGSCTGRFTAQWSYINQKALSIVGLQELEPPVAQLLQAQVSAVGSQWAFYPTAPQYAHQQAPAVLWRTDQWQMLGSDTFPIPKYAWTDCSTGTPVTHTTPAYETAVLLRNAAGQKLWVMSLHNISSTDSISTSAVASNCRPNPPNPTFSTYLAGLFPYLLSKDVGTEAQQFAADYGTGIPVMMIGDFNDDTVTPICTVKRSTATAHSIWDPIPPNGCANPSSTKGQPYEKIFGTRELGFSGTQLDCSTQTSGYTYNGRVYPMTDHCVPLTLATLP